MDIDRLNKKELANLLTNSIRVIECKCSFKQQFQKKSFYNKEKDEKGYYIKCPKCGKKIYTQYLIYNNKKVTNKGKFFDLGILPDPSLIKKR